MSESDSIARVGKTFQTSRAPLPVLHQINLEIASGEIVAILGPSGCGHVPGTASLPLEDDRSQRRGRRAAAERSAAAG